MHNPPSFLYFNPCYAVGYCSVSWEDNLLFANLFHELTEVVVGLGRIVALHYRSSTVYPIHEDNRYLYF